MTTYGLYVGKLCVDVYRKIPIISHGLIFVQKAFFIFGGAYFRRGVLLEGIFRFKIVWACNKNSSKDHENSLKQVKTANRNTAWAYLGRLIIGRIFASEILGAYFREGLFIYLFVIIIISIIIIITIFFFFGGGGGGLFCRNFTVFSSVL